MYNNNKKQNKQQMEFDYEWNIKCLKLIMLIYNKLNISK